VHLVGHSYGGNLALLAALAGRVPVRSLVLFEPTLVQLLRQTGDHEPYAEIERFVGDYRRAHAAGDKWAARNVIDLWGGAGSFEAMPENARNAQSRVVEIAGANHPRISFHLARVLSCSSFEASATAGNSSRWSHGRQASMIALELSGASYG